MRTFHRDKKARLLQPGGLAPRRRGSVQNMAEILDGLLGGSRAEPHNSNSDSPEQLHFHFADSKGIAK